MRAGDQAHEDESTCHLVDFINQVRQQLQGSGWKECVMVNDQRVVLGLLYAFNIPDRNSQKTVEQVIECGFVTYRLDASNDKISKYLHEHNQDSILVTKPNGALVGLLRREDVPKIANNHYRVSLCPPQKREFK